MYSIPQRQVTPQVMIPYQNPGSYREPPVVNPGSNFQHYVGQQYSVVQPQQFVVTPIATPSVIHPREQRAEQRIGEEEEEYNPLKMPCDWEQAKKHALSRRTAPDLIKADSIVERRYKLLIQNKQAETCPCCGFDVKRQEVHFCDSPKTTLSFLGSGFPLFYNFIKYCIILLTVQILVKQIYNMYTNVIGTYCSQLQTIVLSSHHTITEPNCPDSIFLKLSLANKLNDVQSLHNVSILNFIGLSLIMLILLFFRKSQRQLDAEIDVANLTPADYTICVKNIPTDLNVDYKWEIQNIFETIAVQDSEKHVVVKKIVLVYDIEDIIVKEQELDEWVDKKKEELKKNNFNYKSKGIEEIDEKIEKVEKQIHHMENEYVQTNQRFAGIAFVSFETEGMKELVLEHNKHSFSERVSSFFNRGKTPGITHEDLSWHDQKLFIEPAPEPNDVDWEFIHITTHEKIICRIRSWILYIIFESTVFGVIYLISTQLGKMVDQAHEEALEGKVNPSTLTKLRSLSYGISFLIVLFNKFGVATITHHIVDSEKISNKTSFQISFARKYTVALFMNAAGISYIIDIIIQKNIYGFGGFIFNESIIFLLNAFFPPLVWLCDPWGFAKNIWRDYILRNKNTYPITQAEANTLMEEPDYLSAKRYSDIMKTMWFTFLFGSCIPLGLFASFIGLILYYYIDKYNVLYRRTIKESISIELSKNMISMLEYIIFFSAVGGITINYAFTGSYTMINLILLGISIIYVSLPMESISQYFWPIKADDEEALYDDAKFEFDTDYDRENPVIRREAIKEWNKQLKERDRKHLDIQGSSQHHQFQHHQVVSEEAGYKHGGFH